MDNQNLTSPGSLEPMYRFLNHTPLAGRVPPADVASRENMLGQLARWGVDTINRTPGNLTGFDCKECLNRGFTMHLREDLSKYARDCTCVPMRECVREMEKSGMKNILELYRFSNFEIREPWQQDMLTTAQRYANNPEGWLLICGQSGSGKTHVCTAVCRKLLLRGYRVRYMLWRDTFEQVKFHGNDPEKQQEMKEKYRNAQVLYIDDLFKNGDRGSAQPSRAEVAFAFELLNWRYANGLRTILSTERSPEQLIKIDEAIGGRIAERCGSNIFYVDLDPRRNQRLKKWISGSRA